MDCFRITGGVPLRGCVAVSGSKNAALPILAASILATHPVQLVGIPRLLDVETLLHLLAALGIPARRLPDGTLRIETADNRPIKAGHRLVRRMRASFCVLGPLLARRGRAVVGLPGGCKIGTRPVDLHLAGLEALGAELRIERGYVIATGKRLRGSTISMRGPCGPTVTGTANVMCAATSARGTTILQGAATEPEIVDLGNFLNALGAEIRGLGTDTIEIRGIEVLGGARYRIIPDRIEAATLLLAVAITGGSATVTQLDPNHLSAVLESLTESGAKVRIGDREITVEADASLRPVGIAARPYPFFPTDVQAQLTALLALARGTSSVQDDVFPQRFMHVAELNRLGARIHRDGNRVVIHGVAALHGAQVTACDLRASAALVLAGLAAQGQTTVRRIHHLDRGYERLEAKLSVLGAQVERFPVPRLGPAPQVSDSAKALVRA